jgi:hypothetical protein
MCRFVASDCGSHRALHESRSHPEGRSRPFPPKAVLGPAFTPGWARQQRSSVSSPDSPVSLVHEALAEQRRRPVNGSDNGGWSVHRTRRQRRAEYRLCRERPKAGASLRRASLTASNPASVPPVPPCLPRLRGAFRERAAASASPAARTTSSTTRRFPQACGPWSRA